MFGSGDRLDVDEVWDMGVNNEIKAEFYSIRHGKQKCHLLWLKTL